VTHQAIYKCGPLCVFETARKRKLFCAQKLLIILLAVESSLVVLVILEPYLIDVAGGSWVTKARTDSSKGENNWIQIGRGICKVV
jgi:hypothetical protein